MTFNFEKVRRLEADVKEEMKEQIENGGVMRRLFVVAIMAANGPKMDAELVNSATVKAENLLTFLTNYEILLGHCSRADVTNKEKSILIKQFKQSNAALCERYGFINKEDFFNADLPDPQKTISKSKMFF